MSGVFRAIKKLEPTNVAKTLVRKITAYDEKKKMELAAIQAQKDATTQQAEIAARQAEQQQALQNMQTNASIDLKSDNLTSVIAGGTADLLSQANPDVKKKRTAGGLASSLGLNV